MNRICRLSNSSDWSGEKLTIFIKEGDPEWEEAYKQWIAGKNPTASIEWKKGVFGHYTLSRKPDS